MLFIISSNVKGDNISLDFESVTSLSDITDWSYSNFVLSSKFSNGTGSKSLSTDGKTSCYIQCDKKLDNITNVTFYISKETTNKNPDSYFKAEFSENGEIWTDLVKSPTFDNVTKGQWTEVTVAVDNKSGYIRISYIGTTAKRLLDDIQISYIPQTGPSITASDVTYAADITSGEIPYTINNPVDGTVPTATSSTTWIKNVVTITGQNKVTFDMSENTETTPRTGTITLKYGDAPEKIVNVTQLAAVAKRTVTIETPENGTLKVYRGEEEVTSGSLIPQGTELRVEVTANEGYKFRNWQAVDGSTNTYTSTFTYTVGESNVTFSANFDEIVYHTITWSVNGVETTEQVEEGTAITFATPTENIPEGYVFKGWYGSTYGPLDVAPEYVTSAIATADVTYYAVFAKSNGGGTETATLTANFDRADTGYNSKPYIDDKGYNWTTFSNQQGSGEEKRFGLNKNAGYYFGSPEFPGTVTKIKMSVYNGSSSAARTFYIDSQETSQSGDLGTISVDANEKFVEKEATLKSEFNKFYVHSSDALSFKYIAVTYSSEVFTDFRTSVTAPTTATITLAEACTDGKGMYYGTYSSSKPFVVPGDITVSEINVANGKLNVQKYETGAIVPANTGVMVSSAAYGDHTVTLSDEVGESVLGNDNMLRPTGDKGITAGDMATNDANCKYYRLTMHNGETLGFFYGAADGAAFKVLANKAYLAVPAETAAKMSSFVIGGGSTTAIDGIEAGNGANASRKVYNLQGQRVSGTLPKGLYIIDGRKVIVK